MTHACAPHVPTCIPTHACAHSHHSYTCTCINTQRKTCGRALACLLGTKGRWQQSLAIEGQCLVCALKALKAPQAARRDGPAPGWRSMCCTAGEQRANPRGRRSAGVLPPRLCLLVLDTNQHKIESNSLVLPVCCPTWSHVANLGSSLHGLMRVKPFSSKKSNKIPASTTHSSIAGCHHRLMTTSRFVLGSSIRVLMFCRISLIWMD
jgi:hypothetical protein